MFIHNLLTFGKPLQEGDELRQELASLRAEMEEKGLEDWMERPSTATPRGAGGETVGVQSLS